MSSQRKKKKVKKTTNNPNNNAAVLAEAEAWLDSLSVADIINSTLFDTEEQKRINSSYSHHSPFPCYLIKDFLEADFAAQLENELKQLDYYHKSNDLYEFMQSSDLRGVSNKPLINKLRSSIYSAQFRTALQHITGIDELLSLDADASVSMSAAVYGDKNYLLCHDDELQGRRIAYIYYLVPKNWSEQDGGHLDLFSVDSNNQPSTAVQSYLPSYNSFIFFEVSPKSYHQVREVLSSLNTEFDEEGRVRLSISGWFHGKNVFDSKHLVEPLPNFTPMNNYQNINDKASTINHNNTSSLFEEWVNRDYRKAATQKQIRKSFEQDSSIELTDFFKKEKFELLLQQLNSCKQWQLIGPINKRKYYKYNNSNEIKSNEAESENNNLINEVQQLFSSSEFASFLHNITNVKPISYYGELREFQRGCYTLAYDNDKEKYQEALDVNYNIIPYPSNKKTQWPEGIGGSIHYIAEGEAEELLSTTPKANTITIIYRAGAEEAEGSAAAAAGGVMKFVKYLTHSIPHTKYDYDYMYRLDKQPEHNSSNKNRKK
jgi:Rps23 Pro-64 3,4-dihydroxylase Tpa1-like proline 4-hydroxylase